MYGKRGLMPNTDIQTFMVALPRAFRERYDNIIMQMTLNQPRVRGVVSVPAGATTTKSFAGGAGGALVGGDLLDPAQESSIAAYHSLNRFLQKFIDHVSH